MKFQLIAFPLVLLIEVFTYLNFFSWQQQSVYEFNQRQLDLWVNYSVDAAVQEMLSDGTHLNTDYIDWGSMTIEPEVALRVYQGMLLRNMGWGDSDRNREDIIEDYTPFFMVCAPDGYYMYCRQHELKDTVLNNGSVVREHSYGFHWTPKIPYSRTVVNEDGSAKVYFYYLGSDRYGTCNIGSNNISQTVLSLKEDNVLNDGTGLGSRNMAKVVIAETITNAMNSALFTGLEGDVDAMYYIPAEMSEWSSSNSVESPTILTYVSTEGGTIKYDIVSFGIGGSKIDNANFVVCYKRNGNKLYAWATDRDALGLSKDSVLEVLTSAEEAAMKGYYFDVEFYWR